jgi:hypothetical protein
MNCASQHHHWAFAIFDGSSGKRNDTPCIVVGRVGQVERTNLLTVFVPVNVGEYSARHVNPVLAKKLKRLD